MRYDDRGLQWSQYEGSLERESLTPVQLVQHLGQHLTVVITHETKKHGKYWQIRGQLRRINLGPDGNHVLWLRETLYLPADAPTHHKQTTKAGGYRTVMIFRQVGHTKNMIGIPLSRVTAAYSALHPMQHAISLAKLGEPIFSEVQLTYDPNEPEHHYA